MACHPRATCHIAGCKNFIRHIENCFMPYFILFLFLMQFRLRRAAAFVSSPIHLLLVSLVQIATVQYIVDLSLLDFGLTLMVCCEALTCEEETCGRLDHSPTFFIQIRQLNGYFCSTWPTRRLIAAHAAVTMFEYNNVSSGQSPTD